MTPRWFPPLETRILGNGRPADQRRAAARLNTLSLFILNDDVCDKMLEMSGGGECVSMCFLPL